MKKWFATISIMMPQIALAEDGKLILPRTNQTPYALVMTIMYNTVLPVLSIIALGSIVWGGVTIMSAGGNDEQVAKGRRIITFSVVGILILLCSYSIIWALRAFLLKNLV